MRHSQRFLRGVLGPIACIALSIGHAEGQGGASRTQIAFCKIAIPLSQQESKDTVAFKFRVNEQGGAIGISLVRRGLFVVDERPFIDCISKWTLPVTDLQYLATFSTRNSAVWQEIDVDSKTFHRKLSALPPSD